MTIGQTIELNLEDLKTYTVKQKDSHGNRFVAWMDLYSQLRVDGLCALYERLPKQNGENGAQQGEISIAEFRGEFAEGLLKDLETISKTPANIGQDRQAKGNKRIYLLPFKKEFYKIAKGEKLDNPELLAEYQAFLEAYAKLDQSNHVNAFASAQILLDAQNKNFNPASFTRETIEDLMKPYIEGQKKQTAVDLKRNQVYFKGPDGELKHFTFAKFQELCAKRPPDSEALGLSEAQKEFILTSWQQGTFASGWPEIFVTRFAKEDYNLQFGARQRPGSTALFIDASGGKGEVKLYNNFTYNLLYNPDPETAPKNFVEGTLEIDISGMHDKSTFIPGLVSTSPEIRVQFTQLSEMELETIPKGLKTRVLKPEEQKLSDQVKEAVLQQDVEKQQSAVRDVRENNDNAGKARDYLLNVFGQDKGELLISEAQIDWVNQKQSQILNTDTPQGCVNLVTAYCQEQTDTDLQKIFAKNMLGIFLQKHPVKDLDKLKNTVAQIFEPAYAASDKKTKNALKRDVENLVMECAKDLGVKMSPLQQVKEKFRGIKKDSKKQNFIKQANEIREIIKDNLKQNLEKKTEQQNVSSAKKASKIKNMFSRSK